MMGLRRPDDVAFVENDGVAYVACVPKGPIHVLDEVATIIWEEAVDGDRLGLPDRVAERTGATADEVRADVEVFVGHLLALGLLTASGDLGEPG